MKYRAAIDPTLGRLAIMASESGGNLPFNVPVEFPVATFSSAVADFPLDTKKLAENIADLLNHRAPLHTLPADGRQIFYTRTDDGIVFKTHQDGQAGVSVPAVTIAVSSKSSVADLGHSMLLRMDRDFMKRVCSAFVAETAAEAHPAQSTGCTLKP
jgi:hypothetical protein